MKKTWLLLLSALLVIQGATAGQPVAFYLKNLPAPRIGTDPDADIVRDLRADGFLVVEVDCAAYPKTSPELEKELLKFHLASPALLKKYEDQGVQVDYNTILYVPAGYRVERNIPVWNIERYGPPRIKDFIRERYNIDAVRKFKVPPVDNADQIVSPKGKPIDYNLYIDFIYPSGKPARKVPLLLNFASNNPRFLPFSPQSKEEVASRAIFPIGFLTSGYAFANLDHCFIPFVKKDMHGHFKIYSLDAYTAVAYITSSIRYIHSQADRFNLNGKIGTMGISKAAYAAAVSGDRNNASVKEKNAKYGTPPVEQPYQGYPSSVDVVYSAAGVGTHYIVKRFDAGSAPVVTSMGKHDRHTHYWTHYPVLLSNLDKTEQMHLDFWMEDLGHTYPCMGTDFKTGEDRYVLFKRFFDHYLKPDEHNRPEVFYILPKAGVTDVRPDGTFRTALADEILPGDMATVPKYDPVTVRFLLPMDTSEAPKFLSVVCEKTGRPVAGQWTPTMQDTYFRFIPAQSLEKGGFYTIQVRKGMPAKSGTKLAKTVTRKFRVAE